MKRIGLFISVWGILFVAVMGFGVSTVSASITDGVIDVVFKYSWADEIGWITFGEPGGNVHVTDTTLTGSAWSPDFGWIVLNPSSAGVMNNGEGVLSGEAWGESTGWIDFAGVTIDSDGYFHGYANGDTAGQISFNCLNTSSCGTSDFKVRTDWRPQSVRPDCNNSLDDDGDGNADYPSDSGCSSINDPDEEVNSVAGGTVTYHNNSAGGGLRPAASGTQEIVEPDCVIEFDDIDAHWGYRYIEELYCLDIVSGRSRYKFEPDDGATRAEVTKIALLMNHYSIDKKSIPTFPDVSDKYWYYHTVGTGENTQVISGYGDGLFRPTQKVTRAELAKIFLLASGYVIPEQVSYSFSDVPESAWFYRYIGYAFSLNILQGYADGLFRPNQEVTRAEAAKIAVFIMHM
jgi:hypothetical protein